MHLMIIGICIVACSENETTLILENLTLFFFPIEFNKVGTCVFTNNFTMDVKLVCIWSGGGGATADDASLESVRGGGRQLMMRALKQSGGGRQLMMRVLKQSRERGL